MGTTYMTVRLLRSHTAWHWSHLKHGIGEWSRRVHSRSELMSLGDDALRDIGLSRCDAEFEACKPFWML
jgi:uncharacterized protein YjiS (DUF1127 family)